MATLDDSDQDAFLTAVYGGDRHAVARYFARSDVAANVAAWNATLRARRLGEPTPDEPPRAWFDSSNPNEDFASSVVGGAQVELLQWVFAREQLSFFGESLRVIVIDILRVLADDVSMSVSHEIVEIVVESPLFQELMDADERLDVLGKALNAAASIGLENLVRALLAYGAEPNRSCDYEKPMTAVVYRGNIATLDVLLAHGAWLDGAELLTERAYDRSECIVTEILRRGADANAVVEEHGSLLHQSASSCAGEITRALLQDGFADVDARDEGGRTPLLTIAGVGVGSTAARLGTPKRQLLKMLLDAGADVHAVDNKKKGVLHHVAYGYGDVSCLRFLLECDVGVNLRDATGHTAMLVLLERTHGEVFGSIGELLCVLLQAGADPFISDHSGLSSAEMLERTESGRKFVNDNPSRFPHRQ